MQFYTYQEALELESHYSSIAEFATSAVKAVTVTPAAFLIKIRDKIVRGYYVNLYVTENYLHTTPYKFSGKFKATHPAVRI